MIKSEKSALVHVLLYSHGIVPIVPWCSKTTTIEASPTLSDLVTESQWQLQVILRRRTKNNCVCFSLLLLLSAPLFFLYIFEMNRRKKIVLNLCDKVIIVSWEVTFYLASLSINFSPIFSLLPSQTTESGTHSEKDVKITPICISRHTY